MSSRPDLPCDPARIIWSRYANLCSLIQASSESLTLEWQGQPPSSPTGGWDWLPLLWEVDSHTLMEFTVFLQWAAEINRLLFILIKTSLSTKLVTSSDEEPAVKSQWL